MTHPYVSIDLDKIEYNARTIANLCRVYGLTVTGVTKCTCGHPEVAKAMMRGGVSSIGESQLQNVYRLRSAGVRASYMLLRLPSLSEVAAVVDVIDVSLNSELAVLAALSQAAQRRGQVHHVIIMVDLGDLREGVWPSDLVPFVREALRLPGIGIAGIGTNLACFSGVIPSEDNMQQLAALAGEIEQTFGLTLKWISGANSSGLNLIAAERMPVRVNHARIGEAILLGRETTHRQPWPDTFQDAFVLHAEVLELKQKPSVPVGARSENAFGHLTAFTNHSLMTRALVNVGREEVDIAGITPRDSRLTILGASSGYLVMNVTGATNYYRVSNELTFSLNYGALLTAMASEYMRGSGISYEG